MSTSPYRKTSAQLSRARERELLESNLIHTQALADVLKDAVVWHTCGRYKLGLSRLGGVGGGLVILVQQIREDRFVYCYRVDDFLKKVGENAIHEELRTLRQIVKAAAGAAPVGSSGVHE